MLPRRRWLLGRSLLRGHMTLLVAPAGVGKSTHGIARAVAVATGRDITGEPVHEQVKTWVYNIEDDTDELKRRLGAVLQHSVDPVRRYAQPASPSIPAPSGRCCSPVSTAMAP